jgi:glucose-6-phosphate-specific signal transduction histidine kinase
VYNVPVFHMNGFLIANSIAPITDGITIMKKIMIEIVMGNVCLFPSIKLETTYLFMKKVIKENIRPIIRNSNMRYRAIIFQSLSLSVNATLSLMNQAEIK